MKTFRQLIGSICLTLLTIPANAQVDEKWVTEYRGGKSDAATAITTDASGNVFIVGYSSQTGGDANTYNDTYTAKYHAETGGVIWKRIDSYLTSLSFFAAKLSTDGSGNLIVGGKRGNSLNAFVGTTMKRDAATGAILWQVSIPRFANGWSGVEDLTTDATGNVFITGMSRDPSNGNADIYTAKYAGSNGALLWERRYNGVAGDNDSGSQIKLDSAGNVIVAGTTYAGTRYDTCVCKYDGSTGAVIWERIYTHPTYSGSPRGIATDSSGNVFVAASLEGQLGYTAKYDAADGTTLWEKTYGTPSFYGREIVCGIVVDANGNAYVGGSHYVGPWQFKVTKYNGTDGSELWISLSGIPLLSYGLYAHDIKIGSNGNPVLAGVDHNGNGQAYHTVQYAGTNGTELWHAVHAGGDNTPGGGYQNYLALAPDGGAVVTGSLLVGNSQNTVTLRYTLPDLLGPTGGTMSLTPPSVSASQTFQAQFQSWTDPREPLSYSVKVDGILVSPAGTSTTRTIAPPQVDGPHTITGLIADGFGNVTEVSQVINVIHAPPQITTPNEVAVRTASHTGTVVTYSITVTDLSDPNPTVVAVPPSGTLFPLGTTQVTVTATDSEGNTNQKVFPVIVSPGVTSSALAHAGKSGGVLVGNPLIDVPGFQLDTLGVPSITNQRRIAMRGTAKNAAGLKISGLMLGQLHEDGTSSVLMPLRVGGMVPESAGIGAGLVWKVFPKDPFLSQDGGDTGANGAGHYLGVYGRVSGPGITAANDDVLAFYSHSGTSGEVLSVFAREGDPVPEIPEAKYKSFVSAASAFREDGVGGATHHIAFLAMLKAGTGGVNSSNDMALFFSDDLNGTTLVLREGQSLGTKTVKSFAAMGVSAGHVFTRDDNPDHNSGGMSTTALVNFTDGTKQLMAVGRTSITPLATALSANSWSGTGPELKWATFRSWFRNAQGNIGVLTDLLPGGSVSLANNLAIAAEDIGGNLERVVTKGDMTGDGAVFTALKAPVMNSSGSVGFEASLTSGAAIFQRAYFLSSSGLLPYFDKNAPAPDAGGGEWSQIVATTLPDGMGPLFTAKLRLGSSGVTSATDVGLWAVDSHGVTHLLIREGATAAGKTVRSFKALTKVNGTSAQTHSFNENRDVIVWMQATDLTEHLVHFAVP